MTAVFTAIGATFIFSFGFIAGSLLKAAVYDSQDWLVLRWDPSVFGYRPVAPGAMVYRGEKVVTAVRLDTSAFPDEGVRYPVNE